MSFKEKFSLALLRAGAFLLIFLGLGCGAFGDLSETKDQVVETNRKMDQLVSNTDTTVDEIKKSNENQEVLKEGVNDQLPIMNHLLETSLETQKVLRETKAELSKVNEALLSVNNNLRQLVEQGVENERGLASMVEAVTSTNARIDELSAMIGEMVGAVDEQKGAFLRSTLDELGKLIADKNEENAFRVSRAILVFRILRDYSLDTEWYEAFFATRLETCDANIADPKGKLCRVVFHVPGPDKSMPVKWQTAQRKWVSTWPLWLKTRIPLQKLQTNPVWSLALDVEAVEAISKTILSDSKSPMHSIVMEFMEFSRDILTEHLESSVALLSDREPTPSEIDAFLQGAKVVSKIMQYPDFFSDENGDRLRKAEEEFLEKIDSASMNQAEVEPMIRELELL